MTPPRAECIIPTSMLRADKFRTWTVIAALTMAVLYGSFCSTACAIAALPIAAAPSHCEKCDHARPSDPSQRSQAPSDHNCGRHVHPTDFVKAANAPNMHSGAVTSAHAFAARTLDLRAANSNLAWASASGLAPPGRPEASVHANFSVLRI